MSKQKTKCQHIFASGKTCGRADCKINHVVKQNKKKQQIQHNKKVLLESLVQSLGVVTSACKKVGIDRTTFYRYVNEDSEFAEAVKDVENIALDHSETMLHQQINSGNITAIIFHLKTKGKKRGYIEKQEVEQTIKDYRVIEPGEKE